MKLGQALKELKRLKSQLARKINLREKTFSYKQNKQPDQTFEELTTRIRELIDTIKERKLKIEYTNNISFINEGKRKVSIADFILQIADIRSQLKSLENLHSPRMRLFDDEKESTTTQKTEFEIEAEIERLEEKKDKLDNQLQKLNWEIDLVDDYSGISIRLP